MNWNQFCTMVFASVRGERPWAPLHPMTWASEMYRQLNMREPDEVTPTGFVPVAAIPAEVQNPEQQLLTKEQQREEHEPYVITYQAPAMTWHNPAPAADTRWSRSRVDVSRIVVEYGQFGRRLTWRQRRDNRVCNLRRLRQGRQAA